MNTCTQPLDVVALTKEFVSIKSIPQHPEQLEDILRRALSHLEGFTVEHFERNGVKSALVYNRPERPVQFKILLNGHLDVIPGKNHQYVPRIEGDRLYGVGSMDMKANVACLLSVFRQLGREVSYPLALQLVTDEQIGGFHGTKYQVEQGVRAEFVITAEPTNFNIVHQCKGVLWLRVTCRGKTAHGAYPWRGENAVLKMNDFLNTLKQAYPSPRQQEWVTTVNVSSISTNNQAINKIPDDCEVKLDIRFVPEQSKTILETIRSLLPADFELEIMAQEPALFVEKDNEFLCRLKHYAEDVTKSPVTLYGAQGSSDARHFTNVGCPGVEFGPIGGGIGTDEEWVDLASLPKYQEILKAFLRAYA